MMTLISENIKILRKNNHWTQEQLAEKIGIKRSLLGAYEEGRADPRLNNLQRMSEIFGVSIDQLISQDLSNTPGKLMSLDSASKFKVLSITVDSEDKENIELVQQKASAGYMNGYADPEYLKELPRFQLPMLSGPGTYRAFEVSGDSMLPLMPGTVIIGQYVESMDHLKEGRTYVLVSEKEGVVYKRIFFKEKKKDILILVSDNKSYSSFEIPSVEILEIWEAKAFLSFQFPEPSEEEEMNLEKLAGIVRDLQKEVIRLKE